ncbi:MAG: phospho-N-acetylmuramoyl-pentapeptide-transferase [Candidatus Omnitrophica bacterium]|nr:phospho-N-acetylmuramoyl-pentapeptide-transferase [Candidatus Omnitrophota bacterium]
MFYHLLYPLSDYWFGFNVFKYITFRAAFCGISAFLFSLALGPYIINRLANFNIREKVLRSDAPALYEFHKHKEGTPTMGGILIITSMVLSTLFWADLTNKFIIYALAGVIWLGVIGFIDDYIKIKGKSKGLRATTKLLGQFSIAAFIGIMLFLDNGFPNTLSFPFFKNFVINLGLLYILYAIIVIIASSNAVNITDGLDGLAIGCIAIIAMTYAVMSYITGHAQFSQYLNLFYNPGAGELTVFCTAILGSALGFLWYNAYPASIFMGDTGSLALGGAIGMVALFIKMEILLFLVAGIFVLETLSVLIQVGVFKLKKRRTFLMAPIHHHFQFKGLHENKIIVRFWIVAIVLSLLALATLKLR